VYTITYHTSPTRLPEIILTAQCLYHTVARTVPCGLWHIYFIVCTSVSEFVSVYVSLGFSMHVHTPLFSGISNYALLCIVNMATHQNVFIWNKLHLSYNRRRLSTLSFSPFQSVYDDICHTQLQFRTTGLYLVWKWYPVRQYLQLRKLVPKIRTPNWKLHITVTSMWTLQLLPLSLSCIFLLYIFMNSLLTVCCAIKQWIFTVTFILMVHCKPCFQRWVGLEGSLLTCSILFSPAMLTIVILIYRTTLFCFKYF
jgi:hypothetical protein